MAYVTKADLDGLLPPQFLLEALFDHGLADPALAGELQIEGEVVHVIAHRLVDLSRWLGSLSAPSRDFH